MLKSKKLNYTNCLVFFLSILYIGKAQHDVSKYEKRWAFAHPFAAIKIKHILPKAMLIYKEVKREHQLDTLEYGGKLDAFRHVYVMAYLAQRIKVRKLRKLGIAHEKGNKRQFEKHEKEYGERADSLACEMDLRNNEIGFKIGYENKLIDDQSLKQKVIADIKLGNAWCLKRNADGGWVDCTGKSLHLNDYTEKWFIPKCLIKTND